jgi:hypothetical protein
MIGTNPFGIFVNWNNTVYIAAQSLRRVLVWPESSLTPIRNITVALNTPYSVFATRNGDLYVDNGLNGRVEKWGKNTTRSEIVMYVSRPCSGLFVDSNSSLYCSVSNYNEIFKASLLIGANTSTLVAGNRSYGSLSSYSLNMPSGIFVDDKFNLYVADTGYNRIQLFKIGQRNAITVFGTGTTGGITLSYPTGVALDADGYLFIVDSYNHRVIASSANGYRCVVGCGGTGSSSNQLSFPQNMAFDNLGNIYVTDKNNSRVQKFILVTNFTGEC